MKRLIKAVIALGYKIKFAGKCHLNATTNIILRTCTFEGKNSLGDYTNSYSEDNKIIEFNTYKKQHVFR